MKIIIDTHIFLWLMYDYKKVDSRHRDILENSSNELYLSSLSIAEIMIKKSIGKLDVVFDLDYVLDAFQMKILNFDARSALLLESLPMHHKDPFDRMIIAQAISNEFKLISVDENFKKYDCVLI